MLVCWSRKVTAATQKMYAFMKAQCRQINTDKLLLMSIIRIAIHLVMKHVELLFQPIMEYKYCHSTSVHTGRTLQNLIHCQFHHQSFVQKALHVQHVNCTVSDPVTSSPVYNDLSQSDIVLPCSMKLPIWHLPQEADAALAESLHLNAMYRLTTCCDTAK